MKRIAKIALFTVATYLLVVAIGLIPVNNGFQPTKDGVKIYVTSNPIHAEVIVPVSNETRDWRETFPGNRFATDTHGAAYVAIGWGDRGFFVNTPTWREFSFSTAANALLLPSPTCVHVTMKSTVAESDTTRAVRISVEQYKELVRYIDSSLCYTDTGHTIAIDKSYGLNDAFFEANGTYHALNTCNCWAGDALQAAGVRVGWLTPLPRTVFLYLPASHRVSAR